jgi:hypothetical protein
MLSGASVNSHLTRLCVLATVLLLIGGCKILGWGGIQWYNVLANFPDDQSTV